MKRGMWKPKFSILKITRVWRFKVVNFKILTGRHFDAAELNIFETRYMCSEQKVLSKNVSHYPPCNLKKCHFLTGNQDWTPCRYQNIFNRFIETIKYHLQNFKFLSFMVLPIFMAECWQESPCIPFHENGCKKNNDVLSKLLDCQHWRQSLI